jgi:hypothetical protein
MASTTRRAKKANGATLPLGKVPIRVHRRTNTMGIFDWLRGTRSNVEILDDRIWLTRRAKLAGITKRVGRSVAGQNGSVAVILVAHFQNCLDDLRRIVEIGPSDAPVRATVASDLRKSTPLRMSLNDSGSIEIVVGERHPLPSHDQTVLEFARSLPCRCRIVHHVSLDDPVVRAFCGDWVESALKHLGMSENTPLKSKLVTRRLLAAQQKMASQITDDRPAGSAEQWMELNCPDLWRRAQR